LPHISANNQAIYWAKEPHFCAQIEHYYIHFRTENKFLIGGLVVAESEDLMAMQQSYITAVKDFLVKLKPKYKDVGIKEVKVLRKKPRLLLEVECDDRRR